MSEEHHSIINPSSLSCVLLQGSISRRDFTSFKSDSRMSHLLSENKNFMLNEGDAGQAIPFVEVGKEEAPLRH